MEDDIRKDLKLLCYEILENVKTESLTEQLTQVQMLYERLLVLNYLQENAAKTPPRNTPVEAAHSPSTAGSKKPQPPSNDESRSPEKGGEVLSKSTSPLPADKTTPPLEGDASHEPPADQTLETQSPPTSHAEPSAAISEASDHAEGNVPPPDYDQKRSLNDRLAQSSIDIGLNDRLAFVKHLFGGAQEDFNRVLSQLNTFTNLRETEEFLDQVVKPEYDWSEKEEYEERLRQLIRKRYGEDSKP